MIPVGGLLGENDLHKSSKKHHYSDVMMMLSPMKIRGFAFSKPERSEQHIPPMVGFS